jgi:hypothetical protein
MSGDFGEWNNEPIRTAHSAPSSVLRAFHRADRRQFWKRAIVTALYIVAFFAGVWVFTK